MSTFRAFSLVVRALAAMLETLVRIQYKRVIACILIFLRKLKMLLHIIGSVLGSDPGRVGSNPAGATIFIATIVQRKEQSTSNP